MSITQTDIDNLLAIGDKIFNGNLENSIKDIVDRNNELKTEKEKIKNENDEKKRLINIYERDFSDTKENVNEVQNPNMLNVLEDYTVMFLLLSYLFMLSICIIFYISNQAQVDIYIIIKTMISALLLTIFLGIMLYIFT